MLGPTTKARCVFRSINDYEPIDRDDDAYLPNHAVKTNLSVHWNHVGDMVVTGNKSDYGSSGYHNNIVTKNGQSKIIVSANSSPYRILPNETKVDEYIIDDKLSEFDVERRIDATEYESSSLSNSHFEHPTKRKEVFGQY